MPPVLVRVIAALLALLWWIPMFGVIDLTVTWDPEWPVVLEAGWGMFFTFVVGLPFALVTVRPGVAPAAVVQLAVATGALALAALVGNEPPALVVALMVASGAVLLAAIRGREPLRPWIDSQHVPLLALGAAGLGPWAVYAWQMAEANRRQLVTADVTNGVDHYSVQVAAALAVVALTAVAGLRRRGRRLHATTAALVTGYLGVVSYFWPGADGGFSAFWSVLAVLWAGAVLGAGWLGARSAAPARPARVGEHPGRVDGAQPHP